MTATPPKAGSATGSAFALPDIVPEGAALWLVRHGETEWSRSGRHTSRTDLSLTSAGVDQAAALGPVLADLNPALVLSSPRARARETAQLAGLTVDLVDADLTEWDYGDYEGLTGAQIRERVPGWTLWTHGVLNGETAEAVTARADRVLTRAAAGLIRGPVVLVAHGHISRVLAARWIGLDAVAGRNLLLGTAAPSVLTVQYGAPAIDRWNMPNPAGGETGP
jgi:broad specificity phosphatase PhoE